jgi:hypothetical protein
VSALATETEVAARRPEKHGTARRLFQPSEVTLEDSILGAWEALVSDGRAQCPVCRGELELTGCPTCGSELS